MKNIIIIILSVLVIILAFVLVFWRRTSNTTPSVHTTSTPIENSPAIEISGKITVLSRNPDKIMVGTTGGNNYVLLIVSSTQIIRDIGGTVSGTFNFNSLHIGDSVGIQGNVNSDGTITPSLVEQMNSQGID